jgi:uncharacterized protein (DUF302 family)
MMPISDEAIKILMESVNMKQEDRDYFLENLPDLDEEGRKSLFEMLQRIDAREILKEEALADIKKYWDK